MFGCNNSKSLKQKEPAARGEYDSIVYDGSIDDTIFILDGDTFIPLIHARLVTVYNEPVDTISVWEGDTLTSLYRITNTVMEKENLVKRPPGYRCRSYAEVYLVDRENVDRVFKQICRSVFSEERARTLSDYRIRCILLLS